MRNEIEMLIRPRKAILRYESAITIIAHDTESNGTLIKRKHHKA